MNLIGKILVVLILVMGLVFMSIPIAVYATHQNWRQVVLNEQATPDKPLGLAKQLSDAQKRNSDLNEKREKLRQQYDAERAAKIQAIVKLENELVNAKTELASLEAKQNELEKAQREAVAAMSVAQAAADRDRKEVGDQSVTAETARKDREAHFKEVVRLTDELNQAANEKDLLEKRTRELAKDLAKAEQVLRKF
jgi:chromosome segregation ATPase